MLAAVTPLPVIGVPVPLKYLDGMDSLLSIVQMPAGVPVAAVAIGNARNAGLLAVRILAADDAALRAQMEALPGRPRRRRTREGQGRPRGRCPPRRLLGRRAASARVTHERDQRDDEPMAVPTTPKTSTVCVTSAQSGPSVENANGKTSQMRIIAAMDSPVVTMSPRARNQRAS